jgi:hypothetical protein
MAQGLAVRVVVTASSSPSSPPPPSCLDPIAEATCRCSAAAGAEGIYEDRRNYKVIKSLIYITIIIIIVTTITTLILILVILVAIIISTWPTRAMSSHVIG